MQRMKRHTLKVICQDPLRKGSKRLSLAIIQGFPQRSAGLMLGEFQLLHLSRPIGLGREYSMPPPKKQRMSPQVGHEAKEP